MQYLGELGERIEVRRNNEITIEEIESTIRPDRIVISPGPGTPDDAGVSMKVISHFAGKLPILGVCLGHQSIGQVFGGQVVRAPRLFHGKPSKIQHDNKTIFKGLPQQFDAGRYHSLVVERETLPSCLEVSATTPNGTIMGLRHRDFKVEGVQFHPESIMTSEGRRILRNFLENRLD